MKKPLNFSLIIAISLPFIMILFVAASIYLPGFFIHPKYEFLYSTDNYNSSGSYQVVNGKLNKVLPSGQYNQITYPKLYIYNPVNNESRLVTYELVTLFTLDDSRISPDGFEIVDGTRSEGVFPFIFWTESDYNSKYIRGHNVSRKLSLTSGRYSYNSFNSPNLIPSRA